MFSGRALLNRAKQEEDEQKEVWKQVASHPQLFENGEPLSSGLHD